MLDTYQGSTKKYLEGLNCKIYTPNGTLGSRFTAILPFQNSAAALSKNCRPLSKIQTQALLARNLLRACSERQPSHKSEAVPEFAAPGFRVLVGASLASERARNGMESSSSGGELARRHSSGGGGSSGRGSFDADPFDIPAKGAPLERLRKWRVSTLLHARRHLLSPSAFRRRDVLAMHSVVCLHWFGLIVVGFEAVCSFFSPRLWIRVYL